MSVSRLLVCVCAFALAIAVHLSGQQPQGRGASQEGPVEANAAAGNAQRGQYLVEGVAMCFECHSTRDTRGNIVPGTRFMGGPMPVKPAWPIDWPVQIPRIAGFAGYTDEEAMRVLTQGAIKRDGTQLRLPMPRFRMNARDAADVIAYLRTM
jgi:mono/diheme cytochrome c family protein